ncbi:nucleotidyltransferase family protein [cf. Phormidesmis sp. LEGE 11477]|uniref:nucleotidyltransferase family protein n=1 Tax=cf. Phormidesmis sp. LEGE 11477 TaxID=1828680 RepID=UPI00187F8121|nr:nucleotidyltransferase domain-containing protein [cf. Phormidesmis sp. LEGE 11477]MBE9064799.1 nucleotidyltransferase domain-containing protein [cf. Phormidesmis sp. LEGE 11477]
MAESKTLAALDPTIRSRIGLSVKEIADFCEEWQIASLDLFGSVLREDFGPNSDLDFLFTYTPDASRSLLRLVRMKHQLEDLTSRSVDLINRKSIEESKNWIRRREILTTAQNIYVQG